jgi:predicted helicase
VVDALTGKYFNRDDFMRELDHFYGAIETTAATIGDYNEKQSFLNTVYEQFFQGFSVKVADTHGIVYTPQPIVQFMVRSVEELLRREFNRSLADPGVHILDPFVGTGNFILRVMEEIRRSKPSALAHKYAAELHCNEVMLLPYYIASMNIEHAYYEAMGEYAPFEGICLVDTFDLAESRQLPMFVEANSARVERQRQTELTVILGNPPYNAGQVNENDNNKNRKYTVIDRRVQETYTRAGTATLRNALSDPYVKAFRWASDRIRDEGIVAFVSNNSFIDNIAFDGMRQHLLADFDAVYVLDLGGNVRKNPKLSGTTHNVFGIQVGVCITFLVRRGPADGRAGTLYYARMDEFWRRTQKYTQLDGWGALGKVDWQTLTPVNNIWLTEGLQTDWDDLLPLGTKDAKAGRGQAIFELYSNGVKTNSDAYVYSFRRDALIQRAQAMVSDYRNHLARYLMEKRSKSIESILHVNEQVLKWIRNTKRTLQRGQDVQFDETKIRLSLYRPFAKQHYYFERAFNEDIYQFPRIFPTPETERENRVICVSGVGSSKPFMALMTNFIPCLDLLEKTQCFPLYTYEPHPPAPSPYGEGESAARAYRRRDNISDWALAQYREHYGDASISKEDIFYHLYALLHHPAYRERYAANLKRELPRVPFVTSCPLPVASFESPAAGEPLPAAPSQHLETGNRELETFHAFAAIGRALAELHLNYESLPEYGLRRQENPAVPPSLRVEKMALSRDKTALRVNDFLTLEGIPPEAYAYKLGSRSALEWVIEQYRVTTDARSGITNDPNRLDDEGYIVRLVGQVVYLSVETQKLVAQIAAYPIK